MDLQVTDRRRKSIPRTRWVKLYVEERGSFGALPLVTRGIAAELLKICQDDGLIACGTREPWQAIAMRLGANQGDRRLLRRALSQLEADGFILRCELGYYVRNFSAYQTHRGSNESSTSDERTVNESVTSQSRVLNESVTSVERVINEPETSFQLNSEKETDSGPLVEKSREEKRIVENSKNIERGRQRAERASKLDENWQPVESHFSLAQSLGVSVSAELANFRDYYGANGKRMVDWGKAFSGWIRRAAEYAARRTGSGRKTATQAILDEVAELEAKAKSSKGQTVIDAKGEWL